MKRLFLAAALVVASFAMPVLAYAAVPAAAGNPPSAVTGAGALIGSGVTLPWGAYVSAILGWLQPIAVTLAAALIAFASRELPSWVVALIKENLTQARIQRAVAWGVTQIDGAVKGKTLDVQASNALVAAAEQYMLTFAPQVAAQVGDSLRPMILAEIAKIGIAPEASLPHALPAKG